MRQWTVQDEINLCKWVDDRGFKKELCTISVNNPVSKAKNSPKNKGYSPKRHFNHRVKYGQISMVFRATIIL